jgi:hypothetical protein
MKLRFPILLALAGTLAVAAPASASVSGAQRAVKKEVIFDHGDMPLNVYCDKAGRNRYSCDIFIYNYRSCEKKFGSMCEIDTKGKARVKQVGNRYSIDYRIYW